MTSAIVNPLSSPLSQRRENKDARLVKASFLQLQNHKWAESGCTGAVAVVLVINPLVKEEEEEEKEN